MDLELMHHFSTNACYTFLSPDRTIQVFRDEVPRVALHFPYLLHQILAFSAIHLAHLSPENRDAFIFCGQQHQNESIKGMRDALLGSVTEDNKYALFATSTFLMATTYGLHLLDDKLSEPLCPLDGMLEIVSLIKGTAAIHTLSLDGLDPGRLENPITGPPPSQARFIPPAYRGKLEELHSYISHVSSFDEGTRMGIISGIDSLFECLDSITSYRSMLNAELRTVFRWPVFMASEYTELFRARHPAALTVALYYCLILRNVEKEVWFLDGWSTRLINAIAPLVKDTPWIDAAQWPLQQLQNASH